jgi:hypothetical protein
MPPRATRRRTAPTDDERERMAEPREPAHDWRLIRASGSADHAGRHRDGSHR